jgi:hypothetical protein
MGSPAAHLGRVGFTPYDAVRVILGLILLTAAALKGHELATEPVAETSLLTSRWFLIGVVEFELFFGLWLCCGLYSRRTWQAALLCFNAFACVSLYKAISGEATCGCFGRVPVNPWYTFILDLTAVAALLLCRPARRAVCSLVPPAGEGVGMRPSASPRPFSGEGPGVRARLGWVFGVFLAAGIPAAFAMGTCQAATINDSGDIFGDSQFVVLEPETWVGKRFPLLKYIDIGDQLAHRGWLVVLYDHDCPRCQEAIPQYQRFASGWMTRSGGAQVALVEMPPYSERDEREAWDTRSCVHGRLDDLKQWFVRAPVQIVLRQGFVVGVTLGEEAVVPGVNAHQSLCASHGLSIPVGGHQSD